MVDVMISYARADAKDFAGRLAEALRHHHIDAWLDTSDIEGGRSGCKASNGRSRPARWSLPCGRPKAESPWVRRERLYALDARKPSSPCYAWTVLKT